MNKYPKLNSIDETEDIEKVREYAGAMNDYLELRKQTQFVQQVLDENNELRSLIWTTQEGVSKPIADLDDEHLKNIITYLNGRGQVNTRIRKEYIKRFGSAPALPERSDLLDYEF